MEPTKRMEEPADCSAGKGVPYLARVIGTNSRNPGSLDILGRIPNQLHMEKRNRLKKMATDKSWSCKYLGNCTGGTFIQDFTCTWFPKHGKGDEKKLWPQKDPDEGRKFWEKRASD